jgi:PPOX class probable F420-dependent enzyme
VTETKPPWSATGLELPARVRDFLAHRPPWFATIATLDPDGTPHQAIVWYLLTEEGIVVNSAEGRRWPRNLRGDPRVSISIGEAYDFVALKGRAQVIEEQDRAQAHIAAMARLYHAAEPGEAEELIANRFQKQERVSFLLLPEDIHVHLD